MKLLLALLICVSPLLVGEAAFDLAGIADL